MPRTRTTGTGEYTPKNGIAVVTLSAGMNQPSIVDGRLNSRGLRERCNRNAIATHDIATPISTSIVAVGSPGSTITDAPPAHAIANATAQNRRVRSISSRSSASSGEPTVVELADDGCIDGERG